MRVTKLLIVLTSVLLVFYAEIYVRAFRIGQCGPHMKRWSPHMLLRPFNSVNCALPSHTFTPRSKLRAASDSSGLSVGSASSIQNSYISAEGSGSPCRIKVIGVGGGGGNAVNRMIESSTGILGVELWAVNTDAQALSRSLAPKLLNIGKSTSRSVTHMRLGKLLWCHAI